MSQHGQSGCLTPIPMGTDRMGERVPGCDRAAPPGGAAPTRDLDASYARAYRRGMATTTLHPLVGTPVTLGTDFLTGEPVVGTVVAVMDKPTGLIAEIEMPGVEGGTFTAHLPVEVERVEGAVARPWARGDRVFYLASGTGRPQAGTIRRVSAPTSDHLQGAVAVVDLIGGASVAAYWTELRHRGQGE
jgi:hypothetical protein